MLAKLNILKKMIGILVVFFIISGLIKPHSTIVAHQTAETVKTHSELSSLNKTLKGSESLPNQNAIQLFLHVFAFLAVFTTSIVAGTVFAYANSVMPGLRKGDDRTFVLSVRELNSSVDNLVFLLVSNGALVGQIIFIALASYSHDFDKVLMGSVALAAYIATLLITFLGNLPLNKAIIGAELPKDNEGWKHLRVKFESRWTRLNLIRTTTSMVSVAALLITLLL